MEKIRVFLAEDHSVVREGIRELISREADMDVVGEAEDGEETVRQVLDLKPDIVLMDIAMPRMNGIQATQQIKEALPSTCILVLTPASHHVELAVGRKTVRRLQEAVLIDRHEARHEHAVNNRLVVAVVFRRVAPPLPVSSLV